MTQHTTTGRSNGNDISRYSALEPASRDTQSIRNQVATQMNGPLPGGRPLTDDEIDRLLLGIAEVDGVSDEQFTSANYAIDDEPDAIAKCPSPAELRDIAAAAEREDLTPDEIASHSRLLWNAIAYFQRRARDYDEAAKREAREREVLREIRDGLKSQVDELAA